ncbi:MAG TPA: sigma-70 family RNA polymerase sigma factor [Nitrospiria bacterium]|nr:sigma-70 family RNA polymerase sigma factor [Nitrospiria bacterium]
MAVGPPQAYPDAAEVISMAARPEGELTNLLAEWGRGSQSALDRLLPYVYDELRTLARSYLRRERPDHTVQTGTLVHEAFVRLFEGQRIAWEGRTHFFGIAARLMRQVLVDHARTRDAVKRGAGKADEPLSSALSVAVQMMDVSVLALDRALDELAAIDPDQARVVELRFFGGLTVDETADVMGMSAGTVKREWTMARAWLRRAVAGE